MPKVQLKRHGKMRDDDIGINNEEMSTRIGTPMYMAPEVILESGDYNEKCDVYSFGILIADVIMDGRVRKLFEADKSLGTKSSEALLQHVVEGWRIKVPSNLASQVPSVVKLLEQCLSKDPVERPSFKDLRDVLRAWNGNLDDRNVVKLMKSIDPYTAVENEFIQRCTHLSGVTNMYGEDTRDLFHKNALGGFDVRSPDPDVLMRLKVTELSHVHYQGRKSLCYVGQSRMIIRMPPHEVLNYFWDWANPDRRRLFNAEDTERSIVEEVNEHHRIVSSTKTTMIPFVSPREAVLRMIWKETEKPRNYILVSESVDHKERPEKKGVVRSFLMGCYYFEARTDGCTVATYTVTLDLKGR